MARTGPISRWMAVINHIECIASRKLNDLAIVSSSLETLQLCEKKFRGRASLSSHLSRDHMVKRDRIESGGFVNGVNGGSKIRAVNCGYCSATVAFSLADVEEHLKVRTFTAYTLPPFALTRNRLSIKRVSGLFKRSI